MAPSTARWSAVRVTVITVPTTSVSPSTTGPLLGGADGEDADLGQVEDRVELVDAVHPEVADRERRRRVICSGVELVVAGGGDERLALDADLAEAERVGVPEDGDDQAAVERDGDADVDLAVADDRVGLERGVHAGVLRAGPGRRPW